MSDSGSVGSVAQVQVERMATGGEAVARLDDGRVLFVRGALPGEAVHAQITEAKKRFTRGIAVEITTAAATRVEPSCRHATIECGGCDWMHVDADAQQGFKRGIVIEQLERLGQVSDPQVATRPMERGHRTTVRCSVLNGRAGYRMRRSDQTFVAESCTAAHPLIEDLIVNGSFGNATEVTLRVGATTGERMVITNGSTGSVRVPDDVLVVVADRSGDAAIHEDMGGRRWRISANSFFQTSSTGGQALVDAVSAAVSQSAPTGSVLDLYSGVGLLGGIAAGDRLSASVESNPSSVADAKHNLGDQVQVHKARVEHWNPGNFDVVIADPARRGLAKGGAAVVDKTGATTLVLVSCDPASLGRDTALLQEQGWRYDRGEVIDMFPDTSRIEVVSTFSR